MLSQEMWSGKRDSNSRPIPWQGIALPTELFPQKTKSALYGCKTLCQENRNKIETIPLSRPKWHLKFASNGASLYNPPSLKYGRFSTLLPGW